MSAAELNNLLDQAQAQLDFNGANQKVTMANAQVQVDGMVQNSIVLVANIAKIKAAIAALPAKS